MINELKSANSAKIGKIFKEARNDIGISKRDIADSLVMSLKYIEAIESGNYAVFPSEGFARAYFIKYQGFLSINCDFPSIYNEDNRKDEIIKKSITKFNTSLIPLLIKAGITLLILFVLLMVYKSIFINKSSDNEIVNIIDNAMNAELIAADIKNNLKEIDELEINNQEDLGDISIENEKINIENNLTLNFLNECWIEIYYENELVANQLFQTGDAYMLDIQKPFKVVVGNADNVEGTYNGVSIDFITNANRLRVNTIIFNDE